MSPGKDDLDLGGHPFLLVNQHCFWGPAVRQKNPKSRFNIPYGALKLNGTITIELSLLNDLIKRCPKINQKKEWTR